MRDYSQKNISNNGYDPYNNFIDLLLRLLQYISIVPMTLLSNIIIILISIIKIIMDILNIILSILVCPLNIIILILTIINDAIDAFFNL